MAAQTGLMRADGGRAWGAQSNEDFSLQVVDSPSHIRSYLYRSPIDFVLESCGTENLSDSVWIKAIWSPFPIDRVRVVDLPTTCRIARFFIKFSRSFGRHGWHVVGFEPGIDQIDPHEGLHVWFPLFSESSGRHLVDPIGTPRAVEVERLNQWSRGGQDMADAVELLGLKKAVEPCSPGNQVDVSSHETPLEVSC